MITKRELSNLLVATGRSQNDIAKATGLSQAAVSKVIRMRTDPALSTVTQLLLFVEQARIEDQRAARRRGGRKMQIPGPEVESLAEK